MNIEEHDSITLMQQQANQSVIDDLHKRGFIDQRARDSVLELLYPHVSWGTWTAQLLNILGCLFITSGLIFYFAFNWDNMSSSYKLHTLEAGIICCAAGAWAFSLSKLSGQLFLTAACILTGVFMAVFGQIYQTGADSYTLFALWALLIFPWVMISQFPALWYIWLVIINTAILIYWNQVAPISQTQDYFLSFILILLNSIFLALREFVQSKNVEWCQKRWHRILLAISILCLCLVPVNALIFNLEWKNPYLVSSAILGLIVPSVFLYYYRFKKQDMWVIAATVISLCLICCSVIYKVIDKNISSEIVFWLLMSVMTLFVFTLGATILKKIAPPIRETL